MTTTLDNIVKDVVDSKIETDADDRPATANTYIDAIPVLQIFADHTYQRQLDRARVARMAEAYDPQLVGILEVSSRDDGTYAVIDGQHRLEMLRLAHPSGKKAHVACNVHTGLSTEQEARLFYSIDKTRRRLTGWDRWNARRGAAEQVVRDIEATAAEVGLRIDPAPKPGHLRCVAACEKIVGLGGLTLLGSALSVVTAAFGDSMDGLKAEIVHGTGLVLAAYGSTELDVDRLVAALSGIAPRQLSARAAALRELHSGQMPRLVASVVVERYNAQPGKKVQQFADRMPSGSKAGNRARKARN